MSPFMVIKDDTASCLRISIKYTPEPVYCLQLKDKNIKITLNNVTAMKLHSSRHKHADGYSTFSAAMFINELVCSLWSKTKWLSSMVQ